MTLEERLAVIEEVLHGVRTDLSARGEVPADRSQRLESAARALRDDYEHDAELTAFTSLDGEDMHASG